MYYENENDNFFMLCIRCRILKNFFRIVCHVFVINFVSFVKNLKLLYFEKTWSEHFFESLDPNVCSKFEIFLNKRRLM